MGNAATFKLVKAELNTTVQEAQKEFAAFVSDTSNLSPLQACTDLINQIRGTFIIIEDKGASLLCEELGKLLNELPIEELSALTNRGKQLTEVITQSFIFIGRYLEYLEVNTNSRPELLIGEINQIRQTRGLTLLKDSHFYTYSLPGLMKPRASLPFSFDSNSHKLLRRYRQMYQAAFIKLLKGYRTHIALQYMARAISQIDKLAANTKIGPMFWVATAAIDVLVREQADIGKNRKLVFSQIDKRIKTLIDIGESEFHQPPSSDVMKELLFILALGQNSSPLAEKIVKIYKMPSPGVTESELAEQMSLLSSPGSSVMQSVSVALNEEILIVKQLVDQAATASSVQEVDPKALNLALIKISDILSIVGLSSPSNVLKQQAKVVNGWSIAALPDQSDLMAVADAVLYAESAVNRLQQGGTIGETTDHVASAGKAQLHSARMVLIDESQNGLVQAKRAIGSYFESQSDPLHLANVKTTLELVRGGLIFLESEGAVEVLEQCMGFIENRLLKSDAQIDNLVVDHLADALSSLELYLESMLNEAKPDANLLTFAKEAIGHL